MTEEEWEKSTNLFELMQANLQAGSHTDRRLRLFGVACCHRLPTNLLTSKARSAIHAAELFADGLLSREQFLDHFPKSDEILDRMDRVTEHLRSPYIDARSAVESMDWIQDQESLHFWNTVGRDAWESIWGVNEFAEHHTFRTASCVGLAIARKQTGYVDFASSRVSKDFQQSLTVEYITTRSLLRDIFGNPLRPVAFDPAWRTSAAVGIATAIYEDRAFDRMPILADALQDAGCENEDILSHCRGDGPHVRGCWVVDLVLGKE